MKIGDHIFSMRDNRIVPFTIGSIVSVTVLDSIKDTKSDTYELVEVVSNTFHCVEDHVGKDYFNNHKTMNNFIAIHEKDCFSSLEDIINDLKEDFS